ncbi:MAG: TIR domain-containing protein [Flavobacteriaceae bacterium]|nr:TIR domain-containing protein [Flavobacteriaceae bacterium]
MIDQEAPKLFISYSWTSPEYIDQIKVIAERLIREHRIDVILDQFDLKDGEDAYAYMERMVTDDSVKKVAVFSDKMYTEKANARKSGAGTEAQIISSELYNNAKNNKYVLVLMENDEDNRPYKPAMFTSKIHIDLTINSKFEENLERLARWVHEKPLNVKPPLGAAPDYLKNDVEHFRLNNEKEKKTLISSIKEKQIQHEGNLKEYLDSFSIGFKEFKFDKGANVYPKNYMPKVKAFDYEMEDFFEIIEKLFMYSDDNHNYINLFNDFFEKLLLKIDDFDDQIDDHLKFVILELFLGFCSLLLRYQKYENLREFLKYRYYNVNNVKFNMNLHYYFEIIRYNRTFTDMSKSNKTTIGHYLQERFAHSLVSFNEIMEVDLILYLFPYLSNISNDKSRVNWHPYTIFILAAGFKPVKIFTQCEIRENNYQVSEIFSDPQNGWDLKNKLRKFMESENDLILSNPSYHINSDLKALCNFDKLYSVEEALGLT